MFKPHHASHILVLQSVWEAEISSLSSFEVVITGRRVCLKAVASGSPRFHSLVLLQNVTYMQLTSAAKHAMDLMMYCVTFSQNKTATVRANQALARRPLLEQNDFQAGELRERHLQRSGFLSCFDQISSKGDYSPVSVSLSRILWDAEGQNSGRSFLLYKSLATDIVERSIALHCVHNLQIKAP